MKTNFKGVFVCWLAFALNAAATTPIITSQPQSMTINNASTANFTVVAQNAATYQWLFGTNAITGATNATLTLDDVTTNQEGSYTVLVTSSTGDSTNSQPAQLTLVPGTIVQVTISTFADGLSNSFLVQLFDHDKPATVENFIHYITSGSFSNMFFDRCVPGFVLQGGDYVTYDRSANGLNGGPVSTGTNIFPSQVDSEFNVGPLIPNTFGTLAMALASGEPNSATSAFFFNLADNSTNLDTQNGGFTVFGRILTGTNVLQYFNTLSAPSNGIYDLDSSISTLPVNYDGTNYPTDANLFYSDFAFQTPPPVDTVPPMVSISFPAPNGAVTNASALTLTGIASDNVGLAEVFCVLTLTTGAYAGESETNAALGTTNWSLDVGTFPLGVYQLTAFAQDGAGNLSAPATEYFSNLLQLTIITNVSGQLTTNTEGLVPGEQYSVTAAPGAGEVFEDWQNQGVSSLDPTQTITAETNLTLTVTLVSNNLPAGLAITSPATGSSEHATNAGDITISGILPSPTTVTEVTCQLFYQSNAITGALPASLNGANWSLTVSNLAGGVYTIVVVAADSSGREGLVTENFTVLFAPPTITTQPPSLTVNTGSSADFSVTASNAATYQWLFGPDAIAGATNATLTLNDVSTNQAGSYTVIVTAPTGDSAYSQPAQLTVVPGTMVQLAFSGYAAGGSSNVVLELFDHDKPATVENFLHYIVSGAYSNMFWTRCVPGFVLQGGDYATTDRTNGPPPNLISINSTFTENLGYTPPFPFQIDNEYGVGPLISNTFGTIAMAKTAGEPDSAANVFFFNLADNSTNLDNQNGGFTVFGRIVSGANVLDYFNTLSTATIFDYVDTSGGPTNGLFDYGAAPFTAIPVNYFGVKTPGDSNFIYVDFTLPTAPVLDTNPPTVAVVYPADGATVTNSIVTVTGTAADNVGVARVVSTVALNGGTPIGGDAIGTANWSIDVGNLAPGTYALDAVAQDGAGNLSSRVDTTFVVRQFPFNVYTNGPGKLSTNLNQVNTVVGSSYVVTAIPAKGALFVNWAASSSESTVSIDPKASFTLPNGLQLTANFVANTLPGGVSFTYPAANAKVPTNSFALTGKVAKSAGLTTITAQIFSKTTSSSVTGPMVTTGSSTWSIPAVQLAPGPYIAQALASNTLGHTTVITEDFTVLAPLTVNITGPGTTSITNGAYLQSGTTYSIKAIPKPGELFYSWNTGSGNTIDATTSFTMTNGLALAATFVSNTLPKGAVSFTYPSANAQVLTNSFMLTGNVSASVNNPQIICQLFSGSSPATDVDYAAVNGTTWSVPMSGLQQGSYTAVAIASDSAGRQTLISESFKLNFFHNAAGTYYGVFFTTNIQTNTAGFFKLTLNASGAMTGKLQFPIYTYNISYPLDSSGGAFLSGGGFDGTTIYFDLNFNLTNGADEVNGYVYSLGTEATFTGYRAVTQLPANTVAGKYVLELDTVTNQAVSGPTNDGYATLTVGSTGSLTLGGTLADNSAFSEGVGVSKDGVWPVFATLYGGHGMLIGWETNVIGPSGAAGSTGTLFWLKAPTKDTYFTNGFNIEASATGTNYVAPVPGAQYQVVFGGGSINPALTNSLTVSKTGQFVPAAGAADKLAISLSASGVITGTIYNPVDNQKLTIRGAFSSPSVGGSGFVLDPNGQTDPFQITPVP